MFEKRWQRDSWQVAAENWIEVANDGGIERVQLRVESAAVKIGLHVC
jgi:hypothetical protein